MIATGWNQLKILSKIKDLNGNVLSVYRNGALRNLMEVTHEYGIDLLVIQEIR
jgi:hypothetical protein